MKKYDYNVLVDMVKDLASALAASYRLLGMEKENHKRTLKTWNKELEFAKIEKNAASIEEINKIMGTYRNNIAVIDNFMNVIGPKALISQKYMEVGE